jgi:acyl-homoserine-lactone acylase
VKLLRGWDYRWSAESVPTALAVYWAKSSGDGYHRRERRRSPGWEYIAKKATADERLESLAAASDKLAQDFGTWKTPWGDINRFQRLTDDIVHRFSDSAPSIPVPFTTHSGAHWRRSCPRPTADQEALRQVRKQLRRGDRVRRFGPGQSGDRGGESGDPKSKHFNDQAERYSKGDLREVYFYRSQLKGHTERSIGRGSRNGRRARRRRARVAPHPERSEVIKCPCLRRFLPSRPAPPRSF